MAAVDALLVRLEQIDAAVDFANVPGNTAPKPVLDLSARAAAVHGLASFEQFLRERGAEWASHLTAARISASQMPGGPMEASDRLVKTFPRRFRELDVAGRPALVQTLAQTLSSLSVGTFVAHDLLFSWPGSNVQASDVEAMIQLVGYERGWSELSAVWAKLDRRKPPSASAESILTAFAQLRHTIAHDVDSIPSPLDVSALTRNVKLIAMLVDVLVSRAIYLTCAGRPVVKGAAESIVVRRVERVRGSWHEYGPKATRAYRRHPSLAVAMASAGLRARANGEVLLALDQGDFVNWQSQI